MRVRLFLFILFVLLCNISLFAQKSQNADKLSNWIPNSQISSLDKRMYKLIKKNPYLKGKHDLRLYHIPMLYNTTELCNFYPDSLGKFVPQYGFYVLGKNAVFRKKKEYIRTRSLVVDSSGNLVAIGDARLIQPIFTLGKDEAELASLFFNNHQIDVAFNDDSNSVDYSYFFCIKGNELLIYKETDDGLQIIKSIDK